MPPPSNQPNPTRQASSWNRLRNRANTTASIATLFVTLVIVGGVVGYFIASSRQKPATTSKSTVDTLSPEDLRKLTEVGANLGTSGQTLNIGANTVLRGRVDVGGDLSITGRLNANGPVTLSQLNITGTTAATGLNVGSNLIVSGTTVMQKSLTVNDLVSINGGLTVSGSASVNALNAGSISVRTISISGPLTIGHLNTQGPNPGISGGSAVGAGGTVSISGNDTAGTVNFNMGTGPAAGVLGTISFRAAYGSQVHVLLSPLTGAAAATPAYVTRSPSGFVVHTDSPAPSGQTASYDYFVTQ